MKSPPRKQKRSRTPVAPPPVRVHTAPPRDPAGLRRHALLLLGLVAIALLGWSNSFSSGFVLDNKILVHEDPRIRAVTPENLDLIFHRELWNNWTVTGLYRPLATLSLLFNYAILGNGNHPAGYHWINFGLHAVNMMLVYALGLLIFRTTAPAFALAAIWGLHPVLTESVTNIIGRSDLMAGFGVLAGLLCHIQATSASGWRKPAWLAALMLVVAFGLFSKESAAVVPAVMLIYDLAFAVDSWRARIPGYLALLPPFACYFYIRSAVLSKLPAVHVNFADNPLLGADFWTARFTAVRVIGKYLWRLLWPNEFSADYSYNQIPMVTWRFQSWQDWSAVISLAVCIAAVLLAIVAWKRSRPLFFFISLFFIALAPTSNVFLLIGTIMAERFLYLPSLAFAGCVVLAVYALARRVPSSLPSAHRVAPAILGAIAAIYAARAFVHNQDWRDEKSLFGRNVRVAPASYKTHMAWAMTLNDGTAAGLDRAILEASRAIEILDGLTDVQKPDAPYVNLGSYYRQRGDLLASRKPGGSYLSNAQSEPWYRKSLAALLAAEKIDRATNEANRAPDHVPGRFDAEYGSFQLFREIGRTYARLGEYEQSLAAFVRGRRGHVEPEFQVDMAGVMRDAGKLHEAAITLLEGIITDPGYNKFASGLVEIYRQIDPKGCAVQGAGSTVSLNPECPVVHDDICAASRNVAQGYRRAKDEADANRTVQTAVTQLGCPANLFQ